MVSNTKLLKLHNFLLVFTSLMQKLSGNTQPTFDPLCAGWAHNSNYLKAKTKCNWYL